MRHPWLIVVLAGGVTCLLGSCSRDESANGTRQPAIQHRTIPVDDVVDYISTCSPTFRVRTTRDVLPGGLSAAMAPAIVVWDKSDFSAGDSIMILNVNHGGNPVSGVTVLRTVVIHPDRLLKAEYVQVPLGGPEAISHGQLRFLFASGGIQLVGDDLTAGGEPDSISDLVLSWEAWRAPGVDYSVMKGMDPSTYQLSMRAYSGVQRFLEDAMQERGWKVYTLDLPGGRAGAVELLKVSLAMGDGAARYVLSKTLKNAEDAWVTTGPRTAKEEEAAGLWREIGGKLGNAHTGGDRRLDLAGRAGYQSVLRSCATMAQYEVDVTTARLIEEGFPGQGKRVSSRMGITGEPEWMKELAQASIAGLFLRGPRIIAFALKDPSAIPGRIPEQLDEAGLLAHENGKVRVKDFTIRGETPWGPASQLLIR